VAVILAQLLTFDFTSNKRFMFLLSILVFYRIENQLFVSNFSLSNFKITPLSTTESANYQRVIDFKTKPLGALGQLEKIALQLCKIQQTEKPFLQNPNIIVFAADHGVARYGVSAYPQDVTWQMVLNFLQGGAAINAFCEQNEIHLTVVDAGVAHDFGEISHPDFIAAKQAMGTQPFHLEKAISLEKILNSLEKGANLVKEIAEKNCNIIGFGEMGIGNTSSAALIMSIVTGIPLVDCVGRGTGIDNDGLAKKINILQAAYDLHIENCDSVLDILQCVGGFEIAMMVGAFLQAAASKMTIMVDGFIATSAFLLAHKVNPTVKEYAIFCHQSDEAGHAKMLQFLDVQAIMKLDMRLGEATGAAVAYPIIKSAAKFMQNMASFESANVSQ
jgi:nicotinate-nucleotide--dimethylbenzimidazole phosphoribosyltransferase